MRVLLNILSRLASGASGALTQLLTVLWLLIWDSGCVLANTVLPKKKHGMLSLQATNDYRSIWPEYQQPTKDDSRSPCPGLNALCNHGMLPRDGKNISFRDMSQKVQEIYNFAPTFATFVPWYAAQQLGRSYWTDTLDLSDLNTHNMIEHDASLIRHDAAFAPDQAAPAIDLIDELLRIPLDDGRKKLTVEDIALFSGMRRAHSRASNRQHTMNISQKLFSSANASTLLSVFGGDVGVLETVLKEERLPDGFVPACKSPFGLTMAAFQTTTMAIESRTVERDPWAASRIRPELDLNVNEGGEHSKTPSSAISDTFGLDE